MIYGLWGGMRSRYRLIFPLAAMYALSACSEEGGTFDFLKTNEPAADSMDSSPSNTTKLVERDVEAPDVFQVTESGLWDGRPSLGGVWVAHPDVKEPERVIIRNTSNSKFVIGALFKRERENPGPRIQVSSDAADALGMLAGAPAQLNVTALRREEARVQDPVAAPSEDLAAASDVETQALDPIAGASAAIDAAVDEANTAPVTVQPTRPTGSSLDKPYIQIGIFSVEQNARNTATAMRQNGMVPTVLEQKSQGKTFWRVIVGPAMSKSERSTLLKTAKGMGFDDAYPVAN